MKESKGVFTITKGTKTVIMVMTVLVLIGILIAWVYYGNINKAEDPRVVEAKIKYNDYVKYVKENNFDGVFGVLDTMELIYLAYEDYSDSYEIGVVQNNRAAAWLTHAILEENDSLKHNCLEKARKYTDKGINLFTNWLTEYEKLSEDEILKKIEVFYQPSDDIYKELDLNKIIKKRVQDIKMAQVETPRRLSVAYTNLAIICRHSDDYQNAMLHNKKALELWPENLTAKNNINILCGFKLQNT